MSIKDLTILQHFESRVDKTGECWVWTGDRRSGYGRFFFMGHRLTASRAAHELYIGPIPDGMEVCHRCDNRKCVKPEHLFIGTRQDNMDDARAKGRIKAARARVRLEKLLAAGGDPRIHKFCSRCRKPKPFCDFQKDTTHPSGLASYCRPCNTEYSRERRNQ